MGADDSCSRLDLQGVSKLLSWKGGKMARKELTDKLSIYIPQPKMKQRPVERLIRLGETKDRSVNYLVVEAILEYLDREEKK